MKKLTKKVKKIINEQKIKSGELSDQDIKALQQRKSQERATKCNEEIKVIMQKYNCEFDISLTLTKKGNFPLLTIIAK